ncbi:hypothetical protein [Pleurocapsa sp. PCC 7319]|uniref:hypothetical protein n=1 Tax=Pleurocapsa sp. PCC 7319 TaxID=118161 RepID=UPI00034A49D4|nr:hypothetical protein [Pleurocapsa sp. PCC 7319]
MTAEAKLEFDCDRVGQDNFDIRKVIPGYETLRDMATSLSSVNIKSLARLLVIGSGTEIKLGNFCQQEPG